MEAMRLTIALLEDFDTVLKRPAGLVNGANVDHVRALLFLGGAPPVACAVTPPSGHGHITV